VDTETLAELAQTSSREQFVAKLPHQFLVLARSVFDDEPAAFSTRVIDPATIKRRGHAATHSDIEVIEIIKAPNNPYPDRVSVGRARNCDIVLRDPSVSKLHAHFKVGGLKLELVDIDSQNGTLINGSRIPPHQPCGIAPGDTISFGSVLARVVDAALLYDVLR
jgi:hypothetical protein